MDLNFIKNALHMEPVKTLPELIRDAMNYPRCQITGDVDKLNHYMFKANNAAVNGPGHKEIINGRTHYIFVRPEWIEVTASAKGITDLVNTLIDAARQSPLSAEDIINHIKQGKKFPAVVEQLI